MSKAVLGEAKEKLVEFSFLDFGYCNKTLPSWYKSGSQEKVWNFLLLRFFLKIAKTCIHETNVQLKIPNI